MLDVIAHTMFRQSQPEASWENVPEAVRQEYLGRAEPIWNEIQPAINDSYNRGVIDSAEVLHQIVTRRHGYDKHDDVSAILELNGRKTFRVWKILAKYRHKKRQSNYDLIWKTGTLQTDTPLKDGATLYTYVAMDGRVWHRPSNEFEDGRFEQIG